MSLPSKLKNFNLFGDGNIWRALIDSVTLPKLTRKVEEWRGGGMHGPIDVDLGLEKLELTFKAGGFLLEGFRAFGATSHNANISSCVASSVRRSSNCSRMSLTAF
jgi:P2 family phage contractile tail tube protein